MNNELWRNSATDLAAAIASKQVSSREVVEAHLARIAEVNPKVNAVTAVLAEEALAGAEAADRAVAAGSQLGPLHGVPLSVKENIDLVGSPTTQGIVAMAELMPSLDAPNVAQLKAAGAIPFARTNLPDFGLRWHTDNALRGATRNPWDASVTAGGSSGGEGAALATGMTPLGLGNDYGGSLRWPAQCNGISSLKPTLGRVAAASSLAPADPPITLQLFAVEGPMARHVRDLRVAFQSMIAADARDPWHMPVPFAGPTVPKRVAVSLNPSGDGIDPRIAAGVERAADALRAAGYDVREVEPPAVAQARDVWAKLVMGEIASVMRVQLDPVLGPDAKHFLDLAQEAVPECDYAGYVGALAERQGLARQWNQFAEEYPLILGPVSTGQPFPVGFDLSSAENVWRQMKELSLVVSCNLLGLPVAVVNAGVDGGLPQNVQIIGARYREDLCLDAAEAIEQRLGVVTPIDPV